MFDFSVSGVIDVSEMQEISPFVPHNICFHNKQHSSFNHSSRQYDKREIICITLLAI